MTSRRQAEQAMARQQLLSSCPPGMQITTVDVNEGNRRGVCHLRMLVPSATCRRYNTETHTHETAPGIVDITYRVARLLGLRMSRTTGGILTHDRQGMVEALSYALYPAGSDLPGYTRPGYTLQCIRI